MKIAVFSYSMTGNNEALAGSVARELSAEHFKITEPKPRTMGTIVWDMLFNRKPHAEPAPDKSDEFDLIIFFGLVWM